MASPVELIVGPARSGKAARVLAAYRDALARAGPGRALMLVPTALRRRATESLLLAAQPGGVLVCPQVLTLPDLAKRLLAAAGSPVREITELARRQVIGACLDGLGPTHAAVLGEVLHTPGLVEALDALFRELKAARVEPDAFGRALAGPLRTPRNRVLALLYGAYQKALQARDVYDDAGQFWHAAAVVAGGEFGPFSDLAILAADGFQDFAPSQIDMLDALSRRAERTLITLTWQPDRPHLFGVTGRTRERLRERFGKRLTETVVDEPSGLPDGLERVRTRLFRMPGAKETAKADGTVSVIRAAGRTREVEEIARQATDLVRGGLTAPGSIAVIARSLEPYATLVREVFPRYGLGFRVARAIPLRDCPIVRAAMALVRLQRDNYSFRAVARLLKSNYFTPAAFEADAETARAAVRLARDAGVWAGRNSYFRAFDNLRGRLDREAEAVDDSGEAALSPEHKAARAAEIDRAEGLLRCVFDRLALPAEATRRTLADGLREILRAAGLEAAAIACPLPEMRARDLRALAALDEVLEEVARLDEAGAATVPLAEFLDQVTHGLGLASISAAEPADAPVVVLDVYQSRALSFDHVFIAGLAEKEFPRRGRRHPFFDDAERGDLRGRGVDLADTGHTAEEEMLFFYTAATRARRGLTLAYPSLDAQGRPALASHYLEELSDLFAPGPDGRRLPITDVGTRDLGLPRDRLRAEREVLASAMFSLWGPEHGTDINADLAVLDALLARGPAAETALTGLAAEWEREHGEAFGPFDGILAAPDIREDLCRRFPGGTTMSARRFEAFGGCPFAFLAGEILGLSPLEEPSPELGPLDLGLVYHGLLERFFSALAASASLKGRLTEETLDEGLGLLEKTAAAYFARVEARGRIGSPAIWGIQKRNVLRDVGRLVRWHAENLAGWRTACTEVPFGAMGPTPAAPPGRREPIAVDTEHGPVRIRGRIDRIDLPEDGGPGFEVIDYKSGSPPSAKDMQAGTSFQLPIYLWAAREMLEASQASGRAAAFFLSVRHPRRSGQLASTDSKGNPSPAYDQALGRAGEYIRRFIDAMRQGQYPVYPRDGCPGHCDFHGICRYARWRIERKWQAYPIAELDRIEDVSGDAEEAEA